MDFPSFDEKFAYIVNGISVYLLLLVLLNMVPVLPCLVTLFGMCVCVIRLHAIQMNLAVCTISESQSAIIPIRSKTVWFFGTRFFFSFFTKIEPRLAKTGQTSEMSGIL